jgi:DNA (cytosine-5)-methyltransferase 1
MRRKLLKHGSLFSGVGGADLGFDAAGFVTVWQCEIDKKARSVLERHWPNATRYEDVTKVKGEKLEPVDVVSFGSPCQDLSVAGRQAGIKKGTRSGLFLEAIRIIEEMRGAQNGNGPRFVVWENVPGALASNGGKDFAKALREFRRIGALDIAWRVLDTSDFGPPQRRRRVFVVADFGGECAGPVLSVAPRVCWYPPTCDTAGTDVAGETSHGAPGGRWREGKPRADAVTADTGGACVAEAQAGHLVFVKAARAKSVNDPESWREGGKAPTLNTFDNQSDDRATVLSPSGYGVRRLTPRECERLQGWPDDHTRYRADGSEVAVIPRFALIGNGISAPVAQWLAENLAEFLAPSTRK